MKKKVYIVSHSHWDREWYMPYEQHHMRLVELMDDLLELFETDPEFNSFHLDGQTIILDDYLEVRPEKRAAVQKAIDEGKLQIGPFYILQDDFLISSESNTRNMLIGMKESKKWGTPVALGYFPDTFGNMGQTPQMMLQAGLKSAAFGRGVKPIGFDNEVLADDNYTSQYSEMFWEGPDGSKIFGLLFANWYSNGNEIPTEREAAIKFWNQKLQDVEKYGATNHYLMMNGVDHQPVQKDVTQAIRLANELFPEYEFVHSNFTDYLEAVQNDLPEDLGTVNGELTSQETDGWYTLANTSSARVYLKQWNTKVSRQLENIAEPLATMAYDVTGEYPHDELDFAWKTLMQNHPHDSICGCSVDEVHREMMTRFEKANEVGKFIADKALDQLTSQIKTDDFQAESYPFVVFNTAGINKTGTVEVEIELKRKTFHEGVPGKLFKELEEETTPTFHVVNAEGEVVNAVVGEPNVRFNYDLPKDAFRIPFMAKYVTVTIEVADLDEFSWQSYALVEGEPAVINSELNATNASLENEFTKIEILENGSLSVLNKETGKQLENLLVFENVGDIANEYIFKQPKGDVALLSTDFPYETALIENNGLSATIRLTHKMEIPASADELLSYEQQAVIDFRNRNASRSNVLVPFTITTDITLERLAKHVEFSTKVNNNAQDHRLRVLFPTQLNVETHEADSIYEVVTRPNKVSKHWENPTNPQHQHAFVNLHDDNYSVTVGNFGLNEYEIVDDTIAVTLLRAVGELGDWGYFPTPEAQCQGDFEFEYSLDLHAPTERVLSYKAAQARQYALIAKQTKVVAGSLPTNHQYVAVTGDNFAITALKRRQGDDALVLRGYNMTEEATDLAIAKEGISKTELLNLLEEAQGECPDKLSGHEIRTIGLIK
ncbi:alpha-mannosidase [Vagococcus zengguangii]|uniref:Alpha-mannosidase n=1 Tax=Vagococcus zengguangii TaxID=2571750 RepID=A0A4D7CTK4_9ENTE|nr:alpha-mannosidase [Vagococcus zengguangii]QCI86212.1 alpha-mannosidase [Vagococcus zengguangii]